MSLVLVLSRSGVAVVPGRTLKTAFDWLSSLGEVLHSSGLAKVILGAPHGDEDGDDGDDGFDYVETFGGLAVAHGLVSTLDGARVMFGPLADHSVPTAVRSAVTLRKMYAERGFPPIRDGAFAQLHAANVLLAAADLARFDDRCPPWGDVAHLFPADFTSVHGPGTGAPYVAPPSPLEQALHRAEAGP